MLTKPPQKMFAHLCDQRNQQQNAVLRIPTKHPPSLPVLSPPPSRPLTIVYHRSRPVRRVASSASSFCWSPEDIHRPREPREPHRGRRPPPSERFHKVPPNRSGVAFFVLFSSRSPKRTMRKKGGYLVYTTRSRAGRRP